MRVLLPWGGRLNKTPPEEGDQSDNSDTNSDEQKQEEEEEEPPKRRKSQRKRKPQRDQPSARKVARRKDPTLPTVANNKLDRKPAAKMAIGGRRKIDDPDEEEYWVQPAENEPPLMARTSSNNNPVPLIDTENPARQEAEPHNEAAVAIQQFTHGLKNRGLEMVVQEGDGNCMFRAVSLQVYGNSDNHMEVRERCMDFMSQNEEHYSNFVSGNFAAYILRKRVNGIHGDNTELQAISELYNRPIEVYNPENNDSVTPMNIFHEEYATADQPIRLSYHDGNHYNAIIDPLVPTAGLGLGLPGLKPGLADQMQVTKAKTESDKVADQVELERVLKASQEELKAKEEDELQRVLKQSSMDFMYQRKSMAYSDLDATNFELEQKVMQSSMDSYRRTEQGRKQRAVTARRRQRHSPTFLPPASVPPVAAAAAVAAPAPPDSPVHETTEYPQTVQELVMNGFELSKVIKAYDLIGDNFDDLLSFLLSNNAASSS